jgi:hypothetical protein
MESSSESDGEGDGYKQIRETSSNGPQKKYMSLKKRKAKGILFKLDPITDKMTQRVKLYVENGAMQKDLRYAREIFGLINTSGRKDFSYVWESPWVEEHSFETPKRKKMEIQQRSMAVRNFVKASSNFDTDNVEKFINNVEKLTKWEEKYRCKEDIKTISRVVQSFERVAMRQILRFCQSVQGRNYPMVNNIIQRICHKKNSDEENITIGTHSFRRSDTIYDVFAYLVATEMNWADCTNGSRNLSIHAHKQMELKRDNALHKMIHALDSIRCDDEKIIKRDEIGIPLMEIDSNMCISHGVIVVGQGSTSATYVLDIIQDTDTENGGMNHSHSLDLTGIDTIQIVHSYSNPTNEEFSKNEQGTQPTIVPEPRRKETPSSLSRHSIFSDI